MIRTEQTVHVILARWNEAQYEGDEYMPRMTLAEALQVIAALPDADDEVPSN